MSTDRIAAAHLLDDARLRMQDDAPRAIGPNVAEDGADERWAERIADRREQIGRQLRARALDRDRQVGPANGQTGRLDPELLRLLARATVVLVGRRNRVRVLAAHGIVAVREQTRPFGRVGARRKR